MICLIEAKHYRCLKYIRQPMGPFHVLVGPNASGKTTFLDVVAFLGRLVSDGLEAAIEERTANFQDLVWGREGDRFELAIEAKFPVALGEGLRKARLQYVRYEVAVCQNPETQDVELETERVILKAASKKDNGLPRQTEFPAVRPVPHSIFSPGSPAGAVKTIGKAPGGNANFYPEVGEERQKRWSYSFKLGPKKSALANLPEDKTKYPVSSWLKRFLGSSVQQFILNSIAIRKASPPGQGRGFKTDGSNLPWVIHQLERSAPRRLDEWIAHLKTALPDLESIRTVERADDKHRYLMLRYSGGLEVPSWMVSDGTLRILALTLPAYLEGFEGVYLIEEPENGIHPRAVESVFQALSSVYDAQILLATHSPVILSVASAKHVLCFAKTPDGATDIVSGNDHPALQNWRGETDLGTLYAGGVLG